MSFTCQSPAESATRLVAVLDYHRMEKRAAPPINWAALRQWIEQHPAAAAAALGAGGGGLFGLLSSFSRSPEERTPLRSLLTGATAGGALGLGAGLMFDPIKQILAARSKAPATGAEVPTAGVSGMSPEQLNAAEAALRANQPPTLIDTLTGAYTNPAVAGPAGLIGAQQMRRPRYTKDDLTPQLEAAHAARVATQQAQQQANPGPPRGLNLLSANPTPVSTPVTVPKPPDSAAIGAAVRDANRFRLLPEHVPILGGDPQAWASRAMPRRLGGGPDVAENLEMARMGRIKRTDNPKLPGGLPSAFLLPALYGLGEHYVWDPLKRHFQGP